MPFLSIITINYNNADGLRKTLESVRTQSFTDYEHIIVDGGSTDGSVEVIQEFLQDAEYAKHVSWWCSEKDDGIWDAMNKGVFHANGKYCLLLNSGDWFCNDKSLFKINEAKPYEDIVYFDAEFVKENSSSIMHYPDTITGSFFYDGSTLSHQNTLIKTDIQKKIPYTNSYKCAGDIEFFMNALIKNNCSSRHVSEVIVCFDFVNGISSNPKTKDERAEEWKRLRMQFFPQRIQADLELLQEYRKFQYRFKGMPYKIYKFLEKLKGNK